MPTLAEVQEVFDAGLLSVPFHRHLGVVIERAASGPRVALPAKPEIVGADGRQSPAAVYTLGDVAASVQICSEVAPRALELEMGAIFFSVSARFQQHRPASGTIEASAHVLTGLDPEVGGPGQSKKTTIEIEAKVVGEDGELAAEQQMSFYVRFMSVDRVREMAPETSEVFRLHGM